MNKVKTIDLQGSQYAKVAERLKKFREENPNGLIEPEPTIREDGQIMFKVRILRDKSKPNSAEATGHALSSQEKLGKDKQFEKLETIAVGRALALLGYMASGEVASSEEMEEFLEYKEQRINEAIEKLETATTVEELRDIFVNKLGNLIAEKRVIEAKNKLKVKLEKPNENN